MLSVQAQELFFEQTNATSIPFTSMVSSQQTFYRLDFFNLKSSLRSNASQEEAFISLPNGLGGFSKYRIYESPVMEEGFKDNYPNIKTYKGQGIDNPQENIRLSFTSLGFHAIILNTTNGTQIISPHDQKDNLYTSYFYKDLKPAELSFECQLIGNSSVSAEDKNFNYQTFNANDGIVRDFRIAISSTSEYSAFYNNNLTDVISSHVVGVNNINLHYSLALEF